jgi:excisionase family DNA binding protein
MSDPAPVAIPLSEKPRNKGGRPKGSRNKPKPPEVEVPTLRPRYMQVANACRYADVSVTTMRRWVRTGVVSSAKIGSVLLISVDSLDALVGRRA